MIYISDGAVHQVSTDLLDQMFRARAQVFGERLGWNVCIENGRERDRYDDMDPVYLIAVDDVTGIATGSTRLLPTMGPNMLTDVFGDMFFDGLTFESALIWECTRFCIHPDWERQQSSLAAISRVTTELLLGICEIAQESGIAQISGVFGGSMLPIYRRGGWAPTVVATSGSDARNSVGCGLWTVSQENKLVLRRKLGTHESVLAHNRTDTILQVSA